MKWKTIAFHTNLFCCGAVSYGVLEVLWRGRTHWTMLLTGGVCLSAIYAADQKLSQRPSWVRCLAGSGIITAVEFSVGCLVNLALGWQVWDYSGRALNLFGQICPLYSGLWFLLCYPVTRLCGWIRRYRAPINAASSPDRFSSRRISSV